MLRMRTVALHPCRSGQTSACMARCSSCAAAAHLPAAKRMPLHVCLMAGQPPPPHPLPSTDERRSSSWMARCSSSTSGAGRTRGACAATARCARCWGCGKAGQGRRIGVMIGGRLAPVKALSTWALIAAGHCSLPLPLKAYSWAAWSFLPAWLDFPARYPSCQPDPAFPGLPPPSAAADHAADSGCARH